MLEGTSLADAPFDHSRPTFRHPLKRGDLGGSDPANASITYVAVTLECGSDELLAALSELDRPPRDLHGARVSLAHCLAASPIVREISQQIAPKSRAS